MIIPKVSIFVLALTAIVHARNECCPGNAQLKAGNCSDGSKIQLRENCSVRYSLNPTDPEEQYFVTADDRLIVVKQEQPIPSDSFCISKPDNIAIVCFDEPIPQMFDLRTACGFISVVFLILTIAVYIAIPRLRDLQGKCILHSLFGLAIAFFFLFLIQLFVGLSDGACVFMAFAVYFTFMIAFFWLNVVSINIWRTTVIPNLLKKSDNRWHMLYCIYGYGMPCCFLISSITTHHVDGNHIKPGFGDGSCFFSGSLQYWAYFYGPVAVLLIVNTVLFVWSSIKLWFDTQQQNTPNIRNLRYKFLLTMKLFLIMGLLWIFELLSYAGANVHKYLDYIWVITDYINALQGILIFLVLVVFRKKALMGLANTSWIGSKCPRSWKTLQDEECSDEEEFKEPNNV